MGRHVGAQQQVHDLAAGLGQHPHRAAGEEGGRAQEGRLGVLLVDAVEERPHRRVVRQLGEHAQQQLLAGGVVGAVHPGGQHRHGRLAHAVDHRDGQGEGIPDVVIPNVVHDQLGLLRRADGRDQADGESRENLAHLGAVGRDPAGLGGRQAGGRHTVVQPAFAAHRQRRDDLGVLGVGRGGQHGADPGADLPRRRPRVGGLVVAQPADHPGVPVVGVIQRAQLGHGHRREHRAAFAQPGVGEQGHRLALVPRQGHGHRLGDHRRAQRRAAGLPGQVCRARGRELRLRALRHHVGELFPAFVQLGGQFPGRARVRPLHGDLRSAAAGVERAQPGGRKRQPLLVGGGRRLRPGGRLW